MKTSLLGNQRMREEGAKRGDSTARERLPLKRIVVPKGTL